MRCYTSTMLKWIHNFASTLTILSSKSTLLCGCNHNFPPWIIFHRWKKKFILPNHLQPLFSLITLFEEVLALSLYSCQLKKCQHVCLPLFYFYKLISSWYRRSFHKVGRSSGEQREVLLEVYFCLRTFNSCFFIKEDAWPDIRN